MARSTANGINHRYQALHGSARFPYQDEIRAAGYGPGGRLSFGYAGPDPTNSHLQEVAYNGVRHINLFAPNRTHKGTTLNRLAMMHTGSLVVVDLRGETAGATYNYRKHVLGQEVVLFDPKDEVASSLGVDPDPLNLAQLINKESPTYFEDCFAFADGITISDNKSNQFWVFSSLDALTLGTMDATSDKRLENPTPFDAVRLFNMNKPEYEAAMFGIYDDDEAEREDREPRQIAPGLINAPNDLVRRAANRLANTDERTAMNILSAVRANILALESPLLQKHMAKSTIDLNELPDGNMTIYIVVPSDLIRAWRRIVRLIVTMCMHTVSRSHKYPDPPVLTLWDEAAICGRSEMLIDSYGMLAGDGNQVVSVWQDLSQLQRLYPDSWETFIANAGMNMIFSNNDLKTMEYFSRLSGTVDVPLITYETAAQRDALFTADDYLSVDDRVVSRPLVPPERIRTMKPYEALFYPAGMNPFFGYKAPYYLDARFRAADGRPLFDVPARYKDYPLPRPVDYERAGAKIEKILTPLIPNS